MFMWYFGALIPEIAVSSFLFAPEAPAVLALGGARAVA